MADEPNLSDLRGFTLRDIVLEVRNDVKDLKNTAVTTKEFQQSSRDFELRIRKLERWKYGIPLTILAAALGPIVYHSVY
jgi:hypothetical protein